MKPTRRQLTRRVTGLKIRPSSDDEDSDSNPAPSKINGLIRSILTRTSRAAYVAYTATPFANILIDPEAVDAVRG